jgi:tetratricopeptide (TPR) repeat protein
VTRAVTTTAGRGPRRWAAVAAGVALITAAAAWAQRRARAASDLDALFAPLTAAPTRAQPARFSVPASDRHRPRAPDAAPPVAPLSATALARLEERGAGQAVAVAFALAGESEQARIRLQRLPPTPAVQSDLAALLLNAALTAAPGGSPVPAGAAAAATAAVSAAAGDALEHLDRALAADPRLPQALWNRALALRALGLPLGAARAFQAVADLAEPGWSVEARAAAAELTAAADDLRARGRQVPTQPEPTPGDEPLTPELAVARRARTEAAANRVDAADRLLRQGRADCRARGGPPRACLQLSLALVDLHLPRHTLPPAFEAARAAVAEARAGAFIPELAHALTRLALLESFRDAHAPAVAHAEEALLLGEPCRSVQDAREFLAESALERRDFPAARRTIAQVVRCPERPSRFGRPALGILAELARAPHDPSGAETLRWLDQTVDELHRAGQLGTGALGTMLQGQARVERDPARARALFRRALEQAATAPPGSVRDEKARLYAYLGLLAEAGGRRAWQEALATVFEMEGLAPRPGCLVAFSRHFLRSLVLVRGPDGQVDGHFDAHTPPSAQEDPRLPPALQPALRGCGEVAVIARAPVLGAAHVLPPDLPWSYVGSDARPAPSPAGPRRRLVVSDPDLPGDLPLPALRRVRVTPAPDEQVVELHGARATAAALLAEMPAADSIELHVHGVMDPRISDAATLVLSPPPAGDPLPSPFLTAAEIQRTALPRRPLVLLGACQAARGARYGPLTWSLPAAFLRAGAALVIASPAPVADADAGPFFDRLRARITGGESPALALRDERVHALARKPDHWSRDLVLFQ